MGRLNYVPSWITDAHTLLIKINKCVEKIEELAGVTGGFSADIEGLKVETEALNTSVDEIRETLVGKQDKISLENGIGVNAIQQKTEPDTQVEATGEQAVALGIKRVYNPKDYPEGINRDNARRYIRNLKTWYNNSSNAYAKSRLPEEIATATTDAEIDEIIVTAGEAGGKRSLEQGGGSTFGNNSISVGYLNWNDKGNCAIFGTQNVNNGDNSIITGLLNYNKGANNFISGTLNNLQHDYAVMFGLGNHTDGGRMCSFTAGHYLRNMFSHHKAVFGHYNDAETDGLFEIGNGANENSRHNAFVITKLGYIRLPNYESAASTTPSGYKTFKCINGVLTAID